MVSLLVCEGRSPAPHIQALTVSECVAAACSYQLETGTVRSSHLSVNGVDKADR